MDIPWKQHFVHRSRVRVCLTPSSSGEGVLLDSSRWPGCLTANEESTQSSQKTETISPGSPGASSPVCKMCLLRILLDPSVHLLEVPALASCYLCRLASESHVPGPRILPMKAPANSFAGLIVVPPTGLL